MKAPLIVKWRYWKNNSAANTKASSYLNYISTREGAEKLDDGWKNLKATKKQADIINALLNDIPNAENSDEYKRYCSQKTRGAASEFISSVFEDSPEMMTGKTYLDYIGTRPRAERLGATALFSDEGKSLELEEEKEKLNKFNGRINSLIISLSREDAEATGYNSAKRWMLFMRTQKSVLAKAFDIPADKLIWYGAFHNESYHPHIHLLFYSTDDKRPGFIKKTGLESLKSKLAAEIFRDELTPIYQEQTESRDELTRIVREEIAELIQNIQSNACPSAELANKLLKLSDALKKMKGRKVYAYLTPDLKDLVNEITDEIAKDDRIKKLYDHWYELKYEIIRKYTLHRPTQLPLSQEETFKPIRNAIIKAAVELNSEEVKNVSIEDDGSSSDTDVIFAEEDETAELTDEPISAEEPRGSEKKSAAKPKKNSRSDEFRRKLAMNYATSLLHNVSGIFENALHKQEESLQNDVDSRLHREIEAKKMGENISY